MIFSVPLHYFSFFQASLCAILAEGDAGSNNQSPSSPEPQKEEHGAHDDRFIPFFTPFANLVSQFANSSGFPLPFASLFNSRSQDVSDLHIENDNGTDGIEHNNRFFFKLPRFVGCNHTTNVSIVLFVYCPMHRK